MSGDEQTSPPRRPSRARRLIGFATALLVAASGLSIVAIAEQPASAVTATEILRGFDPADIISDAVMFNPSTMSASAIQTKVASNWSATSWSFMARPSRGQSLQGARA